MNSIIEAYILGILFVFCLHVITLTGKATGHIAV